MSEDRTYVAANSSLRFLFFAFPLAIPPQISTVDYVRCRRLTAWVTFCLIAPYCSVIMRIQVHFRINFCSDIITTRNLFTTRSRRVVLKIFRIVPRSFSLPGPHP